MIANLSRHLTIVLRGDGNESLWKCALNDSCGLWQEQQPQMMQEPPQQEQMMQQQQQMMPQQMMPQQPYPQQEPMQEEQEQPQMMQQPGSPQMMQQPGPPQMMYQQPQMPPMVQEAPQLAQAPSNPWGGQSYNAAAYSPAVQVTGPTESSPDDKQQQRAQAAASIEAYEMYMKTGGASPAAPPAK
jgi:hypothetical protein